MALLSTIHNAATWALVGLIWTIQLAHYPLFAQVRARSLSSLSQTLYQADHLGGGPTDAHGNHHCRRTAGILRFP